VIDQQRFGFRKEGIRKEGIMIPYGWAAFVFEMVLGWVRGSASVYSFVRVFGRGGVGRKGKR